MRTILFLLGLLSSFLLMGQEPYHWQLTDEDGLPSMTAYNVQQDQEGYMWFGTAAGVCRYDGKEFKYYRHPEQLDDEIIYLLSDKFNRIWYSNLAGQIFYIEQNEVSKVNNVFDKDQHKIKNIKITDDYIAIGLLGKEYNANKSKSKILLIKIELNIKFNRVKTFNIPGGFGGFIVKNKSLIYSNWTRTNNINYLYKKPLDGPDSQETNLISDNHKELTQLIKDSKISQIFNNLDSELITCGLNHIHWIDTKQTQNSTLSSLQFEVSNVQFLKNKLWLILPKGGFILYERKFQNKQKTLLKKLLINRLFLDKEENLWVTTKNSGIVIIPHFDKNLINTNNSPIASHVTQTIANGFEDQTIVGTKKGELIFLEKGKFQNARKIPNTTSIYSIIPDKRNDRLIVGTNETILDIKKDNKISDKINKSNNFSTKKLAFDSEKRLWVGNYSECRVIKDSEIEKENSILNGKTIVNHRTYAIYPDYDENVWIGSTNGLYKYTNEKVAPFLIDGIHNKYYFTSITQSKIDSSIWAGTHGDGLLQIKNNEVINHYKEDNQMASNICNDLFADEYDNLWIATSKGLQKLNLKSNTFELINKYDGLPTNEISNVAVNDSIVYAGTNKGIITFRIDTKTKNEVAPPIHFTNFSIFDKDTTLQNLYELNYDQNSLQVDFIGLGYKCRGDVRYKYRMIGIDTNWVTTDTRFARFPGMSKGDYEFQVVALNEDNVESVEPATLKICIAPPYWETWWFRLGAFLIGSSLIGGFFNFRYKAIRKREKLEFDFQNQLNDLRAQALQTQMNPHFIFNSMNAIQHFLTMQDKENAMIYLSRFAKLIRFIFEQSKQKTISLQKELEFLELYISLEKLRFQDKVSAKIDIDPSVAGFEEDIHLPPLLIQPVVENAFKHGLFHKNGEGNLHIKFSYQEPILSCTVEDDGIGREKSALLNEWRKNTHTSSGIKATKERIELLNNPTQSPHSKINENSFVITDLSEKGLATGTKVEIKLKNQFIYD